METVALAQHGGADFTLEALLAYLDMSVVALGPGDLLDAAGESQSVIDITCGSGTFLVSLAAMAIREARRAPKDVATDLITRLHGVDIDPLAVLMARSQTFAALASHLHEAPPPRVFWQNTQPQGHPLTRGARGEDEDEDKEGTG